ncbi:MAG: hypothetical protein ACOYLB_09055 [Phototrophicaceae bacterium]
MATQPTNPLQDARQHVPNPQAYSHPMDTLEEEHQAVADVDQLLKQARPHAIPNRERTARSIMDKIATRQLPVAQPRKSAQALAFSLTAVATFAVIVGTLLVVAGWLLFTNGILLSALAQVLVGLVGVLVAFVRLVTQVMTHTLAQYPFLGVGVLLIPLAIVGLRRLCSGKNDPN